jgi:hypothetical protein
MRHGWLALDPGVTTGWALINDEGQWVGFGDIDARELEPQLDEIIRHFHYRGWWLTAVIEDLPRVGRMSQLGRTLRQVQESIGIVVVETYEIPVRVVAPGTWKPSREARLAKLPRPPNGTRLSQHQKDAIRMGIYAVSHLDKGVPPR